MFSIVLIGLILRPLVLSHPPVPILLVMALTITMWKIMAMPGHKAVFHYWVTVIPLIIGVNTFYFVVAQMGRFINGDLMRVLVHPMQQELFYPMRPPLAMQLWFQMSVMSLLLARVAIQERFNGRVEKTIIYGRQRVPIQRVHYKFQWHREH